MLKTFYDTNTTVSWCANYSTVQPIDTIFLAKSDIFIGMEDFELNKKLELFPNPANHYVIVKGFEHPVRVKIYSITGQLILEKEITAGETIHLGEVDKGIYQVEISQQDRKAYRKLLIK